MSAANEVPKVRVRNRGKVSSTLEMFKGLYKERYPDRAVRYVYDPGHKPELSGVLGRQAMGYRKVMLGDIGMASTSDDEKNEVRVGDLVLMSVSMDEAEEERKELSDRAREQMLMVDKQFRDQIEAEAEASAAKAGGGRKRPDIAPVGGAKIEERLHEYEIDPSKRKGDKE